MLAPPPGVVPPPGLIAPPGVVPPPVVPFTVGVVPVVPLVEDDPPVPDVVPDGPLLDEPPVVEELVDVLVVIGGMVGRITLLSMLLPVRLLPVPLLGDGPVGAGSTTVPLNVICGRRLPTLIMMSPNCSGVVSRPSVSSGSWRD